MRFFGNTSSQHLELSRGWRIIVSSRESGCARNGTNTGKVWWGFPIHDRTRNGPTGCLPLGQQSQGLICPIFNVLMTSNRLFKLVTTALGQRQRSFPPVSRLAAASVLPFTSKFQMLQVESASINQCSEKTYFPGRDCSILLYKQWTQQWKPQIC